MPKRCAFGCETTATTYLTEYPVHRFPNHDKFPERFKAWVTGCGGKLESESDYVLYSLKVACDRHFTANDHNRNKRLNCIAVPSLYLKGTTPRVTANMETETSTQNLLAQTSDPQTCTSGTTPRVTANIETETSTQNLLAQTSDPQTCTSGTTPRVTANIETETSTQNLLAQTSDPQTCTSVTQKHGKQVIAVLNEHNYTVASRQKHINPQKGQRSSPKLTTVKMRCMSATIKSLRSQICKLKKKKKQDFSNRLKMSQKLLETTMFQKVVGTLKKPSQLFVNMQLQMKKRPKGRRFTNEEKILCLSIFKKSPKCYGLLHKLFTLPSSKAMKRLLAKVKITQGINTVIFEKLKNVVADEDTTDKLCSLMFDEMSITPQLNYNDQKDAIEGFAFNNGKFADHVLVFMVKGIKKNFKQPLAYYFTNCLNKLDLKNTIKIVIRHAQDAGLVVINTVCDQSTVNVSAINDLISDEKSKYLRSEKVWRHDCFSVKGPAIVPLFDAPHLIKGIRNNLLTKDLLYTTKNKQKIVKWEYFQKVYDADKAYGELKLLHKLTEEHINPEKINKMRVKTATQVFSHSVAAVTEHLTARGDLPEECRQLVDITLLLDNLFDTLNVSTLHVPDGKIYKGPIKNKSPHHELWIESKKILKGAKFLQKKNCDGKIRIIETNVPSLKNLIRTIEGMEVIWQVISKKYRLDAMLTRNFNQDPVENFFGNIRSYGARNIAPNSVAFEGAFKALLLNNYSAPHSKRANCEEDGNECLQNFDFFLRENYVDPEDTDISKENTPFCEDLFSDDQPQEDLGQRNYVCGWVITKCLKNVCKSCQHCRQTLLSASDKDQKNAFIKAKEYAGKRWLCYPNDTITSCFDEVQKITKSFLKKNVPKTNVKKTITAYCDLLINYPFHCEVHKDNLKTHFVNTTVKLILFSWCRSINRILAGKIKYQEGDDDELKKSAAMYNNKFKHYKNKK